MSLLQGTNHARLERRLSNGRQVVRRTQYSNAERLQLVTLIDKVMKEDSVKPTEAAASFGVSPRSVSRWHKGIQVECEDAHFGSVSNYRGPESFLDDILKIWPTCVIVEGPWNAPESSCCHLQGWSTQAGL